MVVSKNADLLLINPVVMLIFMIFRNCEPESCSLITIFFSPSDTMKLVISVVCFNKSALWWFSTNNKRSVHFSVLVFFSRIWNGMKESASERKEKKEKRAKREKCGIDKFMSCSSLVVYISFVVTYIVLGFHWAFHAHHSRKENSQLIRKKCRVIFLSLCSCFHILCDQAID